MESHYEIPDGISGGWDLPQDIGGAFAVGLLGGGLLHSVKGFKNAPSGIGNRFQGGFSSMITHAPRLGGSFAAWGFVFSVAESAVYQVRGRHDMWTEVLSGAITGGILHMRRGVPLMVASSIISGTVMGMISVTSTILSKLDRDLESEKFES